MHKLASSS